MKNLTSTERIDLLGVLGEHRFRLHERLELAKKHGSDYVASLIEGEMEHLESLVNAVRNVIVEEHINAANKLTSEE